MFFLFCPFCFNNFWGSCFIAEGRKNFCFFFFAPSALITFEEVVLLQREFCPFCLNNFRGGRFIAEGNKKAALFLESSLHKGLFDSDNL